MDAGCLTCFRKKSVTYRQIMRMVPPVGGRCFEFDVPLGNVRQISDKVARVTGTQQAVEHAGRDDAYQEMLKVRAQARHEDALGRRQRRQGRR